MERRHAIGLIGLAGLVLWSVPAAAANDPVAMVEDVKSKSAGVQFMEYLTRGKVIALVRKTYWSWTISTRACARRLPAAP